MDNCTFVGFLRARLCGLLLAGCVVGLTGCGIASETSVSNAGTTSVGSLGLISGQTYGGQQPISGSHIYVYSVGTGGYSGAATSLLTAANGTAQDSNGYYVVTNANGAFKIASAVSCATGTQAYLYASGGTPGGSGSNSVIGLLAPLAACSGTGSVVPAYSFVQINEVTTVVAAFALSGFATDPTHISSSGTALAATGVANAMATALNIVNIGSGLVTSATANGAAVIPASKINTLADALAACVNSSGATGTGTPCGKLFAATGATTDTAAAAIDIAHAPFTGMTALFNLGANTGAPFLPYLSTAPVDWTMGLQYKTAQYTSNQTSGNTNFVDNYSAAFDSAGNLWTRGTNDLAATGNTNTVTTFAKYGPTGALLFPAVQVSGTTDTLNPFVHLGIDSSNTVWSGVDGGEIQVSSTGTVTHLSNGSCSGIGTPVSTVFGSGSTVYVGDYSSANVWKYSGSGCTGSIAAPGSAKFTGYLAVNPSGQVLGSGFLPGSSGNNYVYAVTSGPTSTFLAGGDFITTDNSGDIWGFSTLGGSEYDQLNRYTAGGVGSAQTPYQGGLIQSNDVDVRAGNEGVHIDGAGAVWVGVTPCPNNGNSTCLSDIIAGLQNDGTDPITPSTGMALPYSETGAHAVALDGSGNLWVAVTDGSLLQFVGLSTPVATPILYNQIGVKP